MRPLYDVLHAAENAVRPEAGNAGLWYDKFCDQWTDAWSLREAEGAEPGGKVRWIRTVTAGRVGNAELLTEHHARRVALVRPHPVHALVYAATAGRFAAGLGRNHPIENGFAWHDALGVPYWPASSFKGAVRSCARLLYRVTDPKKDSADILRMFGPPPGAAGARGLGAGSVVFLDMLPVEPVQLEHDVMTPHSSEYYQDGVAPGDWLSPTPIPFLTVAPDQVFSLALLPRNPADPQHGRDCATVAEWLEEAFAWLGAGAKTAVGYGRFGVGGSADEARERAKLLRAGA